MTLQVTISILYQSTRLPGKDTHRGPGVVTQVNTAALTPRFHLGKCFLVVRKLENWWMICYSNSRTQKSHFNHFFNKTSQLAHADNMHMLNTSELVTSWRRMSPAEDIIHSL